MGFLTCFTINKKYVVRDRRYADDAARPVHKYTQSPSVAYYQRSSHHSYSKTNVGSAKDAMRAYQKRDYKGMANAGMSAVGNARGKYPQQRQQQQLWRNFH
ncbi:hypothetical protein MMYC01_209559 [Madurella mycetomatis]|uniref:Uncharacterized protein n=1 Tax=Madurella mycetomatis TaxID=100816 RepID=A0A175VRB4_9PEZI|nr:hypothetical protein MMYC01_209559 [Madurella mycetomatis]